MGAFVLGPTADNAWAHLSLTILYERRGANAIAHSACKKWHNVGHKRGVDLATALAPSTWARLSRRRKVAQQHMRQCKECTWCSGDIEACVHPTTKVAKASQTTHCHTWWPTNPCAATMTRFACEEVARRTLAGVDAQTIDAPARAVRVADLAHDHAVDCLPRTGALPLAVMVRTWSMPDNNPLTPSPPSRPRIPTLGSKGLPRYVDYLFGADRGEEVRHFCNMVAMRDAALYDAIIEGHVPYGHSGIRYMTEALSIWEQALNDEQQRRNAALYEHRAPDAPSVCDVPATLDDTKMDRVWYANTLCRHLLEQHHVATEPAGGLPCGHYCP